MLVDVVRAFTLPDGSHIEIETSDGMVNAHPGDERGWISLDIYRVAPEGYRDLLCCIDYEDALGLRTITYDKDDIAFQQLTIIAPKEVKK